MLLVPQELLRRLLIARAQLTSMDGTLPSLTIPLHPPVPENARLALTILSLLVELLTPSKLFVVARLTFMEMLKPAQKPAHALLAIMAVPLLLKVLPQLPLSLLSAHAPPTPTEMVPHAQTALLTLQDLLVVLVLVPVSLPKLLACVRPTSTVMPEPAHALLVLSAGASLPKHALPLLLICAYALRTHMVSSRPHQLPRVHVLLAPLVLSLLLDPRTSRLAHAQPANMEPI